MSVEIEYSSTAEIDIDDFISHVLTFADETTATRRLLDLYDAIQNLADNLLLSGVGVDSGKSEYRKYSILKGKYMLYFKRPSPDKFKVVMLRPTSQIPPTFDNIIQADKS